jgi:osmotically-inducible protein OsmY
VYLSGSVATIRDWKQADRDARGTSGVSEVQNDLSILMR